MTKTIGYVENISYGELIACQEYARAVIDTYSMNHGGNPPMCQDDAFDGLVWFLEHGNETEGFGYDDDPDTVMEYGQNIIDEIGFIVECSEDTED